MQNAFWKIYGARLIVGVLGVRLKLRTYRSDGLILRAKQVDKI